jgi:hypothetical protein
MKLTLAEFVEAYKNNPVLHDRDISLEEEIRRRLSLFLNLDYLLKGNPYSFSYTRVGLAFDFDARDIETANYNKYILSLFDDYGIQENTVYAAIVSHKGSVYFHYALEDKGSGCCCTHEEVDFGGSSTTKIITKIISLVGTK